MEELENLNMIGRNVKWYNHFGKQFGSVFKKLNIYLPLQFSHSTPRGLPKRKESMCPYTDWHVYTDVYKIDD